MFEPSPNSNFVNHLHIETISNLYLVNVGILNFTKILLGRYFQIPMLLLLSSSIHTLPTYNSYTAIQSTYLLLVCDTNSIYNIIHLVNDYNMSNISGNITGYVYFIL